MISPRYQAKEAPDPSRTPPRSGSRYVGEVVYLFAFDIAYELPRIAKGTLLGQPIAEFCVDAGKRSPRLPFFHRPQMVRFPGLERIGPYGPVRLQKTVKLLPVGAISLSVHVPFEVGKLEELVAFHDLRFSNGNLQDEVREMAEAIRRELEPHAIRPVRHLADEEAYTVFCLHSHSLGDGTAGPTNTEEWLRLNRRPIACLLTQEEDLEHLSAQEATESTARYLSYYERDLTVIDWDAALLVDDPRNFEETLYILELANLQLAELEAYDQLLDEALDRSYRDLTRTRLRSRIGVLRELREIRVDIARFTDELSNITKFFGDWHLARIYEAVSSRFHLSDWHRAVEGKLKTLDDLYQLLQHDQTNRWMLILEGTIVLLFVVDLILLFYGSRH